MWSNSVSKKIKKELIVLFTPFLFVSLCRLKHRENGCAIPLSFAPRSSGNESGELAIRREQRKLVCPVGRNRARTGFTFSSYNYGKEIEKIISDSEERAERGKGGLDDSDGQVIRPHYGHLHPALQGIQVEQSK